jgi:mono/diheme cytochrome c family protein
MGWPMNRRATTAAERVESPKEGVNEDISPRCAGRNCSSCWRRFQLLEARNGRGPCRYSTRSMGKISDEYRSACIGEAKSAGRSESGLEPTAGNLIAGGQLYLATCAGCHGRLGTPFGGKGPILYPPIPELPVIGTELSEAQIFWVAKHGVRRSGMFANEAWASDEMLWNVASYVKHMNSLTPAVQAAIEKLSAAER